MNPVFDSTYSIQHLLFITFAAVIFARCRPLFYLYYYIITLHQPRTTVLSLKNHLASISNIPCIPDILISQVTKH